MKALSRFFVVGILFGIILTKSEAISWFRIQEMFRFQGFHMYGIIMVAIGCGVVFHWLIRRFGGKNIDGSPIKIQDKAKTYKASIFGGILFGLGWAMTGACPEPLYVLLGHGYLPVLVILASALMGTMAYGLLRNRLPH